MSTHDIRPRRVAVVTGGSRGIGRNTVESLATTGVDSIFTYVANREAADEVVAAARALGSTAVAFQLDVTNIAAFDVFAGQVRTALRAMGVERFDYLINNAGISLGKSLAETTEAVLDLLYAGHVKSTFFLTQKLLAL